MCFNTTRFQKPKTAKEDIHCWKTGIISTGANFSSFYQWHLYKPEIVQPQVKIRKIKDDNNDYGIYKGYHSYSTLEQASLLGKIQNLIIREFIIPKGTRYYHDRTCYEYVSETIMMIPYTTNLII